MKKGLLIAFCSLLTFSSLASCQTDGNKKPDIVDPVDPDTKPEEVKASVKISHNEGGTINFVRPDDYQYKVGDLCPLDFECEEGYRLLYVKVNGKKIRPVDGDYIFKISEKDVTIEGFFDKITIDLRDFTFEFDETNKTAKIVNYLAMGGLVASPFVIPSTVKHNGEDYKITTIGAPDPENGKLSLSNSQISHLVLSENIETIEEGALNEILTLRTIEVAENNPKFKAIDGALYSKDEKTLISVPYYEAGVDKVYTVKDSVTTIAPYAFRNNGFIGEIKMGEQVTSIGVSSFQKMRVVSKVHLSNNITSIPDYAFDYCSELDTINIPTSATSIGLRAFNFCNNIYEVHIPASVKTIDKEAFFHVKFLRKLTIEEGLEEIGTFAFAQCDDFTTINFPSTLKRIENYAFEECKSLSKVKLNEGLEYLGGASFQLNLELENVVIPTTVNEIPFNPFLGCALLVPSVAEGSEYFEATPEGIVFTKGQETLVSFPYNYCPENREYRIPSTVKTVGNRSFGFNIELRKIIVPVSVTNMNSAFYNLLPKDNIPEMYECVLEYEGTTADFKKYFLGEVPFNNKAFFKDNKVKCRDGSITLTPFVNEDEEIK